MSSRPPRVPGRRGSRCPLRAPDLRGGVLLVANAWAVIDAKVAVPPRPGRPPAPSSRPRSTVTPLALADAAARAAVAGAAPTPAGLCSPAGGSFRPCETVRFEAGHQVPAIKVPWVSGYGSGFRRSPPCRLVDPYRYGVPQLGRGCAAPDGGPAGRHAAAVPRCHADHRRPCPRHHRQCHRLHGPAPAAQRHRAAANDGPPRPCPTESFYEQDRIELSPPSGGVSPVNRVLALVDPARHHGLTVDRRGVPAGRPPAAPWTVRVQSLVEGRRAVGKAIPRSSGHLAVHAESTASPRRAAGGS